MKQDTSSTLGKGNLVLFISFPTHLYSSLVMDRQGISPSVYNNNDEFNATKTPPTPRCKLKWRRSKPSSSPTSDLPHLREDAQEHMLPSYHLRQDHIGIDTITNKNVKVKSSTPTTAQRLHHLPWHLRQATSRHLRLWTYGIFPHKHFNRSSPSSSP